MAYTQSMTYMQRAMDVLSRARDDLRQVIADAVASGDFTSVASIARMAEGLEAYLRGGSGEPAAAHAPSNGVPAEHDGAPAAASGNGGGDRPAAGRRYPRFILDGDNLVKVGWSASAKAEYAHKAPRAVLDLLVERLTKASTARRRISVERLNSVREGNGSPIPDYQVYACLAWLRAIGAVSQHGRKGYSANGGDLPRLIDDEWKKLPPA